MGLRREILVALTAGEATAHGILHRLRECLGPARPFGAAQVAVTLASLERAGLVEARIVRAGTRTLRRWKLTAAGIAERAAEEQTPTRIILDEQEFLARMVLLAESGNVAALGAALAIARGDLESWRLALGRFAAAPRPPSPVRTPVAARPLSRTGSELLLALAAADLAWLDEAAAALLPLARARHGTRL